MRMPRMRLVQLLWMMQVSATLRPDSVPALLGAMDVFASGIASSLALQNAQNATRAVRCARQASLHPAWPLLLDPQTGAALL